MTEQEYDEVIAPALAEIALKIEKMGGSIVARVEWEPDESGITHIGVSKQSGVGQQLALLAALCRGNIDLLMMEAAKRFDMSQSVMGRMFQASK